jgi:transposase-like protein
MYSYEDRIRAVELYIKLDKRVRPTIRQLGYPTKNSLKGWYNEYQQKLDLPAGYAGRPAKFSKEQKAAAIKHYLTHDRCIAATMRSLGYPCRGTLTAWVREALPDARRPVVGSTGRRRYSGELMQAAVMELCTREESAQAVADKLGAYRLRNVRTSRSHRIGARGGRLLWDRQRPAHPRNRFSIAIRPWSPSGNRTSMRSCLSVTMRIARRNRTICGSVSSWPACASVQYTAPGLGRGPCPRRPV